MKAKLLILASALMLVSLSISAQGDRRERQNNMDITEIYNRQATRLVRNMKLDDSKKDAFTALYLDYQNARHNAVNPKGGDQEGREQRTNLQDLSEDEALELIQKNFERQEKQLAVDKEYLPKFQSILTNAQCAQVFINQVGRPAGGNQMRGNRPGGFGGGRGGGGGFGGGGFGGGGF
ncbi:MAG: hypothetical protein IKN83_12095 [Bacteroidaceae bacterium]|nr:hypothetical protein [Bacteroidaceae bacterium]